MIAPPRPIIKQLGISYAQFVLLKKMYNIQPVGVHRESQQLVYDSVDVEIAECEWTIKMCAEMKDVISKREALKQGVAL